jgi:GAF domain-containing protein
MSGSLVGDLFSRPDPYATPDVTGHPLLQNVEYVREEGLHGFLGIPLRLRNEPYAVLVLLSRRRRRFTAHEIELLRSLGNHAVIALEHGRNSTVSEASFSRSSRTSWPARSPRSVGTPTC